MVMQSNQSMSISLTSNEFLEDPYPFYDRMRSVHPVYQVKSFKYPGWYVTGYEEAKEILLDTRFQNRIPLPFATKKYGHLKDIQNNMLLFKNQVDHRRIRGIVGKAFTPKKMEEYRPFIVETVNDLILQAEAKREMDIVSDFAFPLTSLIIAKILGVPAAERYQFREWSAGLLQTIDFTRTRRVLESGNEWTVKLLAYFKRLIKERKSLPQNDLISLLIKEEQQGDKLTEEELLATCILLVIAGHETTVNLISNAILALENHPEQFIMLKENPELIETAVEEFLRYESPTQMTARIASEDLQINGATIKKGEHVYIFLGAANRDPSRFDRAHVLDVTRNPNPHLSFGYGVHFCLGASLARIEAQMAISVLIQRIPDFKIALDELQWRKLVGFRSLKKLPIIF
ncbi:cytochrome P450 [Bacillus norwichensis]|uniref:Cytochrome P450 n=1 Tax=Bacillus norwichensis TaxID=2762217 RepID=A0ABR8VNZ4_9BACI|nr:cytochrome P450 [Bacillus norwichensis]MBD8006478.1 cytochrome P450 [Bacillus norwichensis]